MPIIKMAVAVMLHAFLWCLCTFQQHLVAQNPQAARVKAIVSKKMALTVAQEVLVYFGTMAISLVDG